MSRVYDNFHETLKEHLADVSGLNDALDALHGAYEQSKTTDNTCVDARLVEDLVTQYNGLTKPILVALLVEHIDSITFRNASTGFKDNEVSCIVENKMIAVAEVLRRRVQKSVKRKTTKRGN